MAPSPISALPPILSTSRLALKLFRGEPAISVFDWHFTPYHSSSERFVTHTGAALHVLLGTLQPGHGKLTWFRVYPARPYALFRLAFTAAPAVSALTGPRGVTRRIILQKARCHPFHARWTRAPTAWKHTISGSISLPSPGYFSPFPHGTVRYRSLRVACLGLWSAQLRTRFFVPGPTQEQRHRSVVNGYATITRYGAAFQTASPIQGGPIGFRQKPVCVLQPRLTKGWRLGSQTVWAVPGSFATTTGVVLSSSGY